MHLGLEVRLGRLGRHVDAVAGDVELPAVVDAAQALFFVAAEEHRGAAVRAGVLHQADRAGRRAEGDQVLAQQLDAQRRAVGRRQLVRADRRHPVLAHQVAHGRAGADATEGFVVLFTEHVCPPLVGRSCDIHSADKPFYSTKISTDGRSLAHSVMTLYKLNHPLKSENKRIVQALLAVKRHEGLSVSA